MRKPKLKITKKFLVELTAPDAKLVTSMRLNKHLHEYSQQVAKINGWSASAFIDRLILAYALSSEKGNNILDILDEL